MKRLFTALGRILSLAVTVLLALVLCCNLYITAARQFWGVQQPAVFGYSAAVVVSGSMSGAIEINDMVIVRHGVDCGPGDVVMFENGRSLVTHRILSETKDAYITKGDANNAEDPSPTPKCNVLGKVVAVTPQVGKFLDFLRSPSGMCILILLALASLLIPVF